MKNHSLSFQIWLVIGLITLFISLTLMVILPHSLRTFFTDEMYASIESAQNSLLDPEYTLKDYFKSDEMFFIEEDIRKVNHFILGKNGTLDPEIKLPDEMIESVVKNSRKMRSNSQRFMVELGDKKVFYIITKATIHNSIGGLVYSKDVFLVSYLKDNYRNDLVKTLFKKLARLSLLILLLSWIPAIILARYLSRPLVALEEQVSTLAKRDWTQEIDLDRRDEIGRLGESVEKLRLELIRQDNMEQDFIQNVSHELKTPTMVIRSYSQAIKDGIFDDLEEPLDIIDGETEKLQDKIQKLLMLSKLDYISNYSLNIERFKLSQLIKDIVGPLQFSRPDLNIVLDLEDTLINGDRENIAIAIENILSNALRYSKGEIKICLKDKKLSIYNNGEGIKEPDLVFKKFYKGDSGETGLGLFISRKIFEIHNFKIGVVNKDEGVEFIIDFEVENDN